MTTPITPQDLVNTIRGDLSAFKVVSSQPQVVLQKCRAALPELTLTREGLHTVLTSLQRRDVTPQVVQQWASFVRRGYVSGLGDTPITPIQIDYAAADEEHIAEVVSRLDELGDVVDGEITADELKLLIDATSK